MRPDAPTPEFSALLDAAPDAMLIIDGSGRVVLANAQAERLFGFRREEMIGAHVEKLIPERFRDAHSQHREAYWVSPQPRPMGQLDRELFGRRADGSEFPVEVSLSPLGLDGEQFVIAAIRDGTMRQAVEARFRKLLEAAPDAMVIVGPQGVIAHVNDQALELFGYARDELVGQVVEMIIPARYRAAHPGHRRRYFEEPRTRPMGQGGLHLFGLRRDGTEFPAEISLSPLVTEDGTLAITAVRDITDRRRQEEERRRLEQAEESVRLRDEFISIAAHELRTPLSAVSMQIESMMRAAERLDAEEFRNRAVTKLQLLGRAAKRLSTLTEQLLDISRIAGGELALQYVDVDLGQLVRATVAQFEDEFARVGSAVLVDVPEAPLQAQLDPLRVEQVLTNLLSNAIKYGPGKPVEIRLCQAGAQAVVTVRDHGIGIDPAEQSRVFDKFERAVSHRQYSGFGLGLWISRRLARAHGGLIGVDSRPGAGSTFTLTLPLMPAESGQPAEPANTAAPRVLVVDDDPAILETYGEALQDEGVEVMTAAHGGQALDALTAGPLPDLILLDLMMPVMDGSAFRSEQQRDPRFAAIPVVLMSAAADVEQRARLLGCGFLRKPISLDSLLRTIAALRR